MKINDEKNGVLLAKLLIALVKRVGEMTVTDQELSEVDGKDLLVAIPDKMTRSTKFTVLPNSAQLHIAGYTEPEPETRQYKPAALQAPRLVTDEVAAKLEQEGERQRRLRALERQMKGVGPMGAVIRPEDFR